MATAAAAADSPASNRRREKVGESPIERSFGSFSRSLSLPDGVDPDGIDASFHNGVLEVRIPKPAERKPRRIEIGRGAAENGAPAPLEGSAQEK